MVNRIAPKITDAAAPAIPSDTQNSSQGTSSTSGSTRSAASSGPLAGLLPRKYKTVGMLKNAGALKDENNAKQGRPVKYLSESERDQYLVMAKGGRLYQGPEGQEKPLDTRDGSNPRGAYLFAMDGKGEIFAASSQTVMHHSAFLAGQPVSAAGSLTAEEGRLAGVTDRSGHYAPPLEYSHQFSKELGRRGVDVNSVDTRYEGRPKKFLKEKNAEAKRVFERIYPEGIKEKKY
ncbi:hypothetical protein OVY01_15185 [Robbsia sp. Bb-Pol-6]|uniref:Uncharacterized protein n=1 Tax=Robbsia betulipollinis TaxID=2981849 RepID=A0ABT3ZQI1_9BURK|nr:hypothetical protein [Robbsia betulipollinis]MCY0388532.1 hypothetical protein [Robbsia betulipollinis]